jgi:hypothetical protein
MPLLVAQGRVACEAGVGLGYDSVSYLQTELISAMASLYFCDWVNFFVHAMLCRFVSHSWRQTMRN